MKYNNLPYPELLNLWDKYVWESYDYVFTAEVHGQGWTPETFYKWEYADKMVDLLHDLIKKHPEYVTCTNSSH